MWQPPWRYRESIVLISGIVVTGFMLQLTVGEFDSRVMLYPTNIIVGGAMIAFIALLAFAGKSTFYKWFSGVCNAATLIGTFMVLGVIMGLTPQTFLGSEPHGGLISKLGLDNIISSWPFVIIYMLTLLSLGMLIARRIASFRWHDCAFYLNHIGLWILLFALGFGAADLKRYVMHVQEGETEWRVYNKAGDILDLPIAIQLNDFDMEEYPPKLAVIDRRSGAVLPESHPDFFQLDGNMTEGRIADWHFHLDEYIHDAVRSNDSTYREARMPGATPAAKVTIKNMRSSKTQSGWVCGGNMAQLYMVLTLDSAHAVVMTKPEPKRFISDINVYTENGHTTHALLEVNKPLKIGNWMLYQYDYDKEAGRMSAYSSFELVYDPWIIPVYIGIIMLMAGAVGMLWTGKHRKEEKNDVE